MPKVTFRQDAGDQIKAAREAKGWTQKDAASRIGVDQATWCRLETHPSKCNVSTLIPALVALGITDLEALLKKG